MAIQKSADIERDLKKMLKRADVRSFLENHGVDLKEADRHFRTCSKRPESLARRIQAAKSKATFPGPTVMRDTGKEQ